MGGIVRGSGGASLSGIAQLESASPSDLAYAEGRSGIVRAAQSRAGCILVEDSSGFSGRTTIEVSRPKLAFIRAARVLVPSPVTPAGIHPSAIVAASAILGEGVRVGPHVAIEENVTVGDGTAIEAGGFLGAGVEVGRDCLLYPRVTLYPGARLGDRVILHAGVVIGSDGFGYVFAGGRHEKFPQAGGVVIEDEVEIGSNSTVDRGSLGVTTIGAGTKVDNLVQIAHNVRLGCRCIVAAQTGISGSVEIGDDVVIGGQVGIGDHVRIESRAVIGSGAGILPGKIIHRGSVVWGTPARPLAEVKRLHAHLAALPELARKVKEMSKRK